MFSCCSLPIILIVYFSVAILYRFSLTTPIVLAIALMPGGVTIFCYPDQTSLSSFLFLHKSNTACIPHDISH